MQGSRLGLNLDDIERDFRVGRRTAQRMRDAKGLAMRPGPRPVIHPDVIDTIRLAIKQSHEIYLVYRGRRSGKSSGRRLQPYGFLFGNRHYLVAVSPDRPLEPRLYALSG